MKIPNPNIHFVFSIVKSIFRIIAAAGLCIGNLAFAGLFFIIAEGLGILEEMF